MSIVNRSGVSVNGSTKVMTDDLIEQPPKIFQCVFGPSQGAKCPHACS
jgi:hypothetical protein